MQARRTFEHSPEGGWSAVAVHLQSAPEGQDGFYLTLFPDGRGPSVVFLRPGQLLRLIDLASQSSVTDQALWDEVAKIPMEPLLPSRTLYPRLRALLVDFASQLRTVARAQLERPEPPASPIEEPGGLEPTAEQPSSQDSELPMGTPPPSPFFKS
jgi:hypothetical protein